MTITSPRFTSRDLEVMPDDGKRYEIIEGELYVTKQPSWAHQEITGRIYAALYQWSRATAKGRASVAPAVVLSDDNDVAPDVAWVGEDRYRRGMDEAGHLRVVPELVVEVLSPGERNVRRDRETKLRLYSRRGVDEYWIVDPLNKTVDVYRRGQAGLDIVHSAGQHDTLATPLLPGFALDMSRLFEGV